MYDIEAVNDSLISIRDKLKDFIGEEESEIAVIIDDYEKSSALYPVSKMQYNFYRLSSKVMEENHLLVGNYVRNKCKEKIKMGELELFWIWDIESCRQFISRSYGVYLCEKECELIRNEGIYFIDNIVIVFESNKYNFNFQEKLRLIKEKACSVSVIFNGIQIGNSKKLILESRNLSYFFKGNSNLLVNLIIDSCREFINANNIQELLLEVASLKNSIINRFYNGEIKYILINAKNPIYNMALIECQEISKFTISDYKYIKERLFENPLSRGVEEKETLEAILSYFLNVSIGEGARN